MSKSRIFAIKKQTVAKIKVKINDVFQFVSFIGGQFRGNDVEMEPAKYATSNADMIKAIEAHPDYKSGRIYDYAKVKLDSVPSPAPAASAPTPEPSPEEVEAPEEVVETPSGDSETAGIDKMPMAVNYLKEKFGEEFPSGLNSKAKLKEWAATKNVVFPDLN